MHYVYLAGPITGLSYNAATDWRHRFNAMLPSTILGLNPLRGKDYLANEHYIKDCYPSGLSTGRGIFTRDYNDVCRSDVVVVNFLGAERVSIGTVMEMSWARMLNIPVVLVMEPEGNVHEHSMLAECVGFRTAHLDQAAQLVRHIILPDDEPDQDWNNFFGRAVGKHDVISNNNPYNTNQKEM